MYDPVVGRFISADPFIQSPDFTQSLNRYAYCINNPLSLIDPSGYSWFSKNWKAITASIVGIAVSVVTAGTASGLGVAIIAGVAGGAAGALTGALLNGANIGQIAKSTFIGALVGGASGFLNFASGDGTIFEQLFKHTFSQGWLEGVQGGNIFHGFMMGATASMGGSFIDDNLEILGKVGEVAANSILSGTIDEIGGGKFANGVVTGAFTILFNDMMHGEKIKLKKEVSRLAEIDKPLQSVYPEFFIICGVRSLYNGTYSVINEWWANYRMSAIKLNFTEHGQKMASSRGFTEERIKEIIYYGKKTFQNAKGGKINTIYTYKDNTVILNHNGNVITTFSNFEGAGSLPRGYFKGF